MKIAFITSVYGEQAVGGAERVVAALAEGLAAKNHQINVISLAQEQNKEQISDCLTLWKIKLKQLYDPFNLNKTKKISWWRNNKFFRALWHLLDVYNPIMSWRLLKILREISPEIVITNNLQGFSISTWSAIKKLNIKIIHVAHDYSLLCPATAMTKNGKICTSQCKSCSIYSNLRLSLAAQIDYLVCPSQLVADTHKKFRWFSDIKYQIIANSIDDDWPEINKNRLQNMQNSPSLRFGFIGRKDQSKGIDNLLEAAWLLRENNFSLLIAGAGEINSFWREIIAKQEAVTRSRQDSISLIKQIKEYAEVNAYDFYQQIDVLIVPSRAAETFCNVAMEAVCLGIPIIVSDAGALPERAEFLSCGWIFPAGNSIRLAEIISHCLNNRHEVVLKAEQAAKTRIKYTRHQQISAYETICQNLLKT